MSDETSNEPTAPEDGSASQPTDVTRPRPRPRPGPAAESETETEAVPEAEPATDPAPAASTEAPAGPVSAASRARRIGGRPVAPVAAPSTAAATEAPAKPSRRHAATPETAPVRLAKEPKAAKEPRPPKEPRAPKPPRDPGDPAAISAQWIPAGVLGAVAVVLAILVAIAGHGVLYAKGDNSGSQRNAFSQQVLAAAKTCLATINTYDYRKLAASEKAALACGTGKVTANTTAFYKNTLSVQAPKQKPVQVAQVNRAAIQTVSANGKSVTVLAYGQLSITTSGLTSPRTDIFGVTMTMQKVGKKWLVAVFNSDAGDVAVTN